MNIIKSPRLWPGLLRSRSNRMSMGCHRTMGRTAPLIATEQDPLWHITALWAVWPIQYRLLAIYWLFNFLAVEFTTTFVHSVHKSTSTKCRHFQDFKNLQKCTTANMSLAEMQLSTNLQKRVGHWYLFEASVLGNDCALHILYVTHFLQCERL